MLHEFAISTVSITKTGQVQEVGGKFSIQRGVKQSDVLSPALFNARLELALAQWKCQLSQHELHIGGQTYCMQMTYCFLPNDWRSLFS